MAVLLLEKSKTRRLFQIILVGIGLLVSGYLTYCLIRYPVNAAINCYHIEYEQIYPKIQACRRASVHYCDNRTTTIFPY
jgi:hypothetical protein